MSRKKFGILRKIRLRNILVKFFELTRTRILFRISPINRNTPKNVRPWYGLFQSHSKDDRIYEIWTIDPQKKLKTRNDRIWGGNPNGFSPSEPITDGVHRPEKIFLTTAIEDGLFVSFL
jgi:hypothetical protein